MKIYIVISLLGILVLLILGSCLYTTKPLSPRPEPWLCSINADGTGFRKIKKVDLNFGTTGFWDIYMTKDDRIIFYGEKLWISDTDLIEPISITDNIFTLQRQPARLSQSPDGSKLYFASRDKNIHELDLNTMISRQLTSESVRTLRNPIISDLGNYITYSSKGYGYPTKRTEYMYWLNLINDESGIIPSPDTISVNPYYSETDGYAYYEKAGLFRSRLDGSDRSLLDNQGGSAYPYSMFSVSKDQSYIAHQSNPTYNNYFIRVYDKINKTGISLPVKNKNSYKYLGVMCKDVNRIFYVSPEYSGKLWTRNLDTGEEKVLTDTAVVGGFEMIAPTWDGSKVFFYAYVEYK